MRHRDSGLLTLARACAGMAATDSARAGRAGRGRQGLLALRVETNRRDAAMTASPLVVAGVPFLADPSGALFLEAERMLVVADLHLEKGSSFARRGMLLPPYDTRATLAALADVIGRYDPRLVLALGDSFHDPMAATRLSPPDRGFLEALQAGRDWIWLTGNHDPLPPAGCAGTVLPEWHLGPLTFRHEPASGTSVGEIAGHLHPAAKVLGNSGVARRRCFVSDGTRCVMPAFGAYAGGLNIHHPAFRPLFGPRPRIAHALGRDRVYPVPFSRCLADG